VTIFLTPGFILYDTYYTVHAAKVLLKHK